MKNDDELLIKYHMYEIEKLNSYIKFHDNKLKELEEKQFNDLKNS